MPWLDLDKDPKGHFVIYPQDEKINIAAHYRGQRTPLELGEGSGFWIPALPIHLNNQIPFRIPVSKMGTDLTQWSEARDACSELQREPIYKGGGEVREITLQNTLSKTIQTYYTNYFNTLNQIKQTYKKENKDTTSVDLAIAFVSKYKDPISSDEFRALRTHAAKCGVALSEDSFSLAPNWVAKPAAAAMYQPVSNSSAESKSSVANQTPDASSPAANSTATSTSSASSTTDNPSTKNRL